MAKDMKVASGVAELITKLRDEGVSAGRNEADRLVDEAQEKAAKMVEKARTETADMMTTARSEIASEERAAKEALKTAIRDTELMLESELKAGFADHVKRLVSVELQDKDFLRQLILEVAGRAAPKEEKGQRAEILLNKELFEKTPEGAKLSKKGKDEMKHFILGISGDMLREGVEIKSAEDSREGMRIRMVGENVEIDLTDNAIADVLLKYLLPRYRAIVAGEE